GGQGAGRGRCHRDRPGRGRGLWSHRSLRRAARRRAAASRAERAAGRSRGRPRGVLGRDPGSARGGGSSPGQAWRVGAEARWWGGGGASGVRVAGDRARANRHASGDRDVSGAELAGPRPTTAPPAVEAGFALAPQDRVIFTRQTAAGRAILSAAVDGTDERLL